MIPKELFENKNFFSGKMVLDERIFNKNCTYESSVCQDFYFKFFSSTQKSPLPFCKFFLTAVNRCIFIT